jgi:hypothetical protein
MLRMSMYLDSKELIFYDLTLNVMDNILHRDELIKTNRDSDFYIIFVLYFIVCVCVYNDSSIKDVNSKKRNI